MRILVIGSGGREHALAYTLRASATHPEVYVAPGNPGTASFAHNLDISPTDTAALLGAAEDFGIDLTVVGPELPLVEGIVDRFRAAGHAIVGPTAAAAQLEGSKAFAKDFMRQHDIPTAAYRTFGRGDYEAALAYLDEIGLPVVVKASGLAAGKGAIVCTKRAAAEQALDDMMVRKTFGAAGTSVIVEEFMTGEEASLFALCDGQEYVLLPTAQDHKRVGENDTGPNTGGMGAYAPAPIMDEALVSEVCTTIIEPTLAGMTAADMPYTGFLYVGLMITATGPRVVEYNCRLGDPEAQVVLPLIESDLAELLRAAALERLHQVDVRFKQGFAACVVLASEGYPGRVETGRAIDGVGADSEGHDALVFQAGTSTRDGALVTSGGRVLGVTGVADTLKKALEAAYRRVDTIHFEGRHFRRDIGARGLERAVPQAT